MDAKTNAAKTLTEHGYPAIVKDGVVLVKAVSETTYSEITKILEEIGYKYSYGADPNLTISPENT